MCEFVGEGDGYDVPSSIEYLTQQKTVHIVDLNEDGVDECLVEPSALVRADGEVDCILGATGNRTVYLLRHQENGWVVIGDLSGIGKMEVLEHRVEGWPDIATSWDAGRQSARTVHRWNGSCYEELEMVNYDTPGH